MLMQAWRCFAIVSLVGCGGSGVFDSDCEPGTVPCERGCCELCLTDAECEPSCSSSGEGMRCVDGLCEEGSCCDQTCASRGAECGIVEDGCGGELDCGTCGGGTTCGALTPYRCGEGEAPQTPSCSALQAECGLVADGVSGVVDCGGCPTGNFCNDDRVCCRSQANLGCGGGDVYWIDSCGDAEGAPVERCEFGCDNGECRAEGPCEARAEKVCLGGNVYWTDSCDRPEASSVESCASGCEDGACLQPPTCDLEDSKTCIGGDVYWLDSCDNPESTPHQICTAGCTAGVCDTVQPPTCTENHHDGCYGGDVYWYNGCDVREGLKESCSDGCQNNACVVCTSQAERQCSGGDLYWYDSCGVREGIAQSCGTDSCSAPGDWQCSGNTRVRTRTCVERGCLTDACFADTTTETETASCPNGDWCVENDIAECADPNVTITSPAASAIWGMSESHRITWNTGGVASTVTIEYDTGSGWQSIATVWNTGSYNWTIADDADDCTANARIRITPSEGYGDTSSGFRIDCAPALTVFSPTVAGNAAEVNGVVHPRCGEMVAPTGCGIMEILTGMPVGFYWSDAQLFPDCTYFPRAYLYLFKGEYTVRVVAKNSCGYTAERSVTVTID